MTNRDAAISELSQLCLQAPQRSSQKIIEEEALVRLTGSPASADEGSISLHIGEGIVATVLEQDVVKVERDGDDDRFTVSVNAACKVLVTQTRVRTAEEVVGLRHVEHFPALTQRPIFETFGDCKTRCDRIESQLLSRIPPLLQTSSLTAEDVLEYLNAVNHARDVWFTCMSSCFDRHFQGRLQRDL